VRYCGSRRYGFYATRYVTTVSMLHVKILTLYYQKYKKAGAQHNNFKNLDFSTFFSTLLAEVVQSCTHIGLRTLCVFEIPRGTFLLHSRENITYIPAY
jgi:hypothetical protein